MNPAKYLNPRFTTGLYLPDWLLEIDISYGAMILYVRLGRLSLKRGYAFASRQTLGTMLRNVTDAQVSSYLGELTKAKLIEIRRTGRASHYYLLAHEAIGISEKEMEVARKKHLMDEPDEPDDINFPDIRYKENLTRDKAIFTTDIKKTLPLYNESEKLERKEEDSKTTSLQFDQFYQLYPKRVGKHDAKKAWDKLKPSSSLIQTILNSVTEQKKWDSWTKDGGKYIPNPATWLNGHRWEDEKGQPEKELTSWDKPLMADF